MRSILFFEILFALALTGCGAAPAEKETPAEIPAPIQTSVREISADSLAASDDALREYGAGNSDAALARAEDALALDAENFHALSVKGLITAFHGEPDAGAALIEKALTISPENVQTHYDMALAKKLGGHYAESISHFQKVLDADPHNTWSLYGIATCYADKRDKENALRYLREAITTNPAAVLPEARTQDHFQWLHGDGEFEKIMRNS